MCLCSFLWWRSLWRLPPRHFLWVCVHITYTHIHTILWPLKNVVSRLKWRSKVITICKCEMVTNDRLQFWPMKFSFNSYVHHHLFLKLLNTWISFPKSLAMVYNYIVYIIYNMYYILHMYTYIYNIYNYIKIYYLMWLLHALRSVIKTTKK